MAIVDLDAAVESKEEKGKKKSKRKPRRAPPSHRLQNKQSRRDSNSSIRSVRSIPLETIAESDSETVLSGKSKEDSGGPKIQYPTYHSIPKRRSQQQDVEAVLDDTSDSSDDSENLAAMVDIPLGDHEKSDTKKQCDYTNKKYWVVAIIASIIVVVAIIGASVTIRINGSVSSSGSGGDDGMTPDSNTITPQENAGVDTEGFRTVYINAGGSVDGVNNVYKDENGREWVSDADFVDSGEIINYYQDCSTIYCSERYFEIGNRAVTGAYEFDVPAEPDTYVVLLHFAEQYFGVEGKREFDIFVEGKRIAKAFDIFKAAGGERNTPVILEAWTLVNDGSVTIEFVSIEGKNNPKINALEVHHHSTYVKPDNLYDPNKTQAPTETPTEPPTEQPKEEEPVETPTEKPEEEKPEETEEPEATQPPKETEKPEETEEPEATQPPKETSVPKETPEEKSPEQEPEFPILIDVGGVGNDEWRSDFAHPEYHFGTSKTSDYCPVEIKDTDMDEQLCTERYFRGDDGGYEIQVPNGQYRVELHFAELFHTKAGKRIFDVAVEGELLEENFDIFEQSGGMRTATTLNTVVQVEDGALTVKLLPVTGDPTINAIEVHRES